MIYKITIEGKQYNCARMSANDQFEISRLLGKYGLLPLLTSKEMISGVIEGLMSLPYDDLVKINDSVLSKSFADGTNAPVTQLTFHDNIWGYWHLVAEVLIENFIECSTSFVQGKLSMKLKLQERADQLRKLKTV